MIIVRIKNVIAVIMTIGLERRQTQVHQFLQGLVKQERIKLPLLTAHLLFMSFGQFVFLVNLFFSRVQ